MNDVFIILYGFLGVVIGYLLRLLVNWLEIDKFKIHNNNYIIEVLCSSLFVWSFLKMPINDAIIFSLISSTLVAIGVVDFYTMQIPLLFIIAGTIFTFAGIVIGEIAWISVFWGVFVGAVIPSIILAITWLISKRQGMGFGDIQMGIVLGAWLGPVRMALTLFGASVLSLITWVLISVYKGFDSNRALPFAPFLAVTGIGIYIGSVYYPSFFHLLIIR